MEELHDLTVSEAAHGIRQGELSSAGLVEVLLGRIEKLEPDLKAWVTVDHEGALGSAQDLDTELKQGKAPRGPLHGIPIGAKDIFYTAGLRTTAGSKIYADFVPTMMPPA